MQIFDSHSNLFIVIAITSSMEKFADSGELSGSMSLRHVVGRELETLMPMPMKGYRNLVGTVPMTERLPSCSGAS